GGDAEGLAPWARRCGAQCDLPAGVPGPVLGGHPVQGGLPVRAARPPRDDDGDAHARLRAWLRRCSQVSYSSGRSKSSVQSSISTKWPRLRPGHRHTCPSGTPAMTRYHWLTRLRLMRPRRRRPVTWSMPRRASLCASGASAIAQFSFQRLPVSFEPFSRPYTVQSATSVVVMVVMAWSDSQMSPNTIVVDSGVDHRCAAEAILSMSPSTWRRRGGSVRAPRWVQSSRSSSATTITSPCGASAATVRCSTGTPSTGASCLGSPRWPPHRVPSPAAGMTNLVTGRPSSCGLRDESRVEDAFDAGVRLDAGGPPAQVPHVVDDVAVQRRVLVAGAVAGLQHHQVQVAQVR